MQTLREIPPLQRLALMAAMATPQHALLRGKGGFHPPLLSFAVPGAPFSLRLMRMLDRAWLIEFDDARFPTRATLTSKGRELATRLVQARNDAETKTKAGAA